MNAKESVKLFAWLVAGVSEPLCCCSECWCCFLWCVLLLFGALVTTFYCNIQNWEDRLFCVQFWLL